MVNVQICQCLSASIAVQVYTRDQQITTAKGIVMARLRSSVRELEVALMKFCFDKLGALCHYVLAW
jgi:N-dimethylarginine dimethylaminohydrolase